MFQISLGGRRGGPQPLLQLDDVADIVQEPGIDLGARMDIRYRHSGFQRIADEPDAFCIRGGQLPHDFFPAGLLRRPPTVRPVAAQAELPGLQDAQGFLE